MSRVMSDFTLLVLTGLATIGLFVLAFTSVPNAVFFTVAAFWLALAVSGLVRVLRGRPDA